MKNEEDWKEVRPIIKGVVALVLHLRHPTWMTKLCFKEADVWVSEVEKEML